MNRHKIRSHSRDERVFRHTAQRMNTVNIMQMIPRGGTRM